MKDIVHSICRLLGQGEPIVLATIVDHEGSTPRGTGSKMIVCRNGDIIGSVGGGLLEGNTVAEAGKAFDTHSASILSFDLNHTEASEMGMICGGKADILLEYVSPDDDALQLYEAAYAALSNGRRCLLSTDLGDLEDLAAIPPRCLLIGDGSVLGDAPGQPGWMAEARKALDRYRSAYMEPIEGRHFFLEPLREPGLLILFGAGHVGQQTAIAGATLGFRILVLDDRDEFADPQRFPGSVDVRTIPNFNSCFGGLPVIDDDSYLVIVTRGHLHDKAVLSQALKTKAGYIGMIGSRKKRDAIYQALLKEGFSEEDLARVHSPIGLSISAETPEEIAISILAELIQVRSEK